MKVSACAIAAVAMTLPVHVLLILGGGLAALALLVYLGIALPAVWSAKPARRRAAADVLRQILNACSARNADECQPELHQPIRDQTTCGKTVGWSWPRSSPCVRPWPARLIICQSRGQW